MKNLLGILVLGLLLSGNVYAGWFDKDKIKVTKCYDASEFNSYKEKLKDLENKKRTGYPLIMTKWEWELNLKEKMAYRTVIMNGELRIDRFSIKAATEDYIIVHDPTGDAQFDLKNEGIVIADNVLGSYTKLQCKFK